MDETTTKEALIPRAPTTKAGRAKRANDAIKKHILLMHSTTDRASLTADRASGLSSKVVAAEVEYHIRTRAALRLLEVERASCRSQAAPAPIKTSARWRFRNFLATTTHKFWVAWYLLRACRALLRRASAHDRSKYGPDEEPYFAYSMNQLHGLEYGSIAYQAQLDRLKPAIEHHYLVNSHHPEHWINGLEDMSPLDVLELLCDWKAAGRRHKTGSMAKSFEVNEKRFKISKHRVEAMRRDAQEMGLL